LDNGVDLKLYDGENTAFLLTQGAHSFAPDYKYISFFSWSDAATVSLKDFKYPLDRYELKRHRALGLSNEPAGAEPVINIHKGTVLCICVEEQQEEV
jgi:thiamine pyrophosphokinase